MAGACDGLGGHRKQLCEALDGGAGARRSCSRRSGRRARSRCSARARTPTRREPRRRCPTCRPGPRRSGWSKEKEVLGFFISGHPLERFRDGGRAVRHPHHRHAGRVERAPGDGGGGRHRGEAADLQEDRQGIRPARARGLPRHRGGDRLPGRLGQAQRHDRARRRPCSSPAATATGTGARITRRSSSSRRAPLDELKASGAVALSLRWRAPGGPEPGRAPGGRGALLGAPGAHAPVY